MEKIAPEGNLIHEDRFEDLDNWHLEGLVEGAGIVAGGVLRLDCSGSRQGGAGCMAFCKRDFPDNICVEYDLFVAEKNGLVITFLAMKGLGGEDAITGVPARAGVFDDYVGENATTRSYHCSVSRYDDKGEHTGVSNWRRNPGLHLMGQGEDLCRQIRTPYHVAFIKAGRTCQLQVNGAIASGFTDPGELPDEIPTSGKVGFRVIGAKAIARFSNFKVTALGRGSTQR